MFTNDPTSQRIVKSVFPEFKGYMIEVKLFTPMRLDSYWCGGTRYYFRFVDLGAWKALGSVPQNGSGYDPGTLMLSTLPEGVALVQFAKIGHKQRATIYVNECNLPKQISEGPIPTHYERIVLAATRGLIASVRFSEAHDQTGITRGQWDEATASLQERGLLDKRKAITIAGRNTIGDTSLYSLGRVCDDSQTRA